MDKKYGIIHILRNTDLKKKVTFLLKDNFNKERAKIKRF